MLAEAKTRKALRSGHNIKGYSVENLKQMFDIPFFDFVYLDMEGKYNCWEERKDKERIMRVERRSPSWVLWQLAQAKNLCCLSPLLACQNALIQYI